MVLWCGGCPAWATMTRMVRKVSRRHGRPVATAAAGLLAFGLALQVVRVVGIQQIVERARLYWFEPRGLSGGIFYVALGDSAAQGVGASGPDRGYVGLLAGRLREATGRPVEVVNLSVSGARMADVVEYQLPRLQELEPDLVTVAVGGNDVLRYDRDRFAVDAARLVAGLPPGTFVADVPHFRYGRWRTSSAEAARVVREAVTAAGLVVVPLNERLRAMSLRATLARTSRDLFHPNDRGYEVWADAFWEQIDRAGRRSV